MNPADQLLSRRTSASVHQQGFRLGKTSASAPMKAIAVAVALCLTGGVQAAGTGVITEGSGSMTTVGAVTTVQQASQGLRIDWSRFHVAAGETLAFVQPNASAVALNVVTSALPAEIWGQLTATGNVFVLSPSGVLLGAGAQVNVNQGAVFSSLPLEKFDPVTGAVTLGSGGGGGVRNAGTITTGAGGMVALIGREVVNEGTIIAPQGQVFLLAGDRAIFKPSSGGVLNYSIDAATVASSVINTGSIQAHGGRIDLDARSLVSSVVNTSGVLEAGAVAGGSDGVIRLTALGPAGSVLASNIVDAGANGVVTVQLQAQGQLNYTADRLGAVEAPAGPEQPVVSRTIGVVANSKTYDGTRAASVDLRVSDLAAGDSLSLTVGNAQFSSKNAGANRQVALTLSSLESSSPTSIYTVPQTLSAAILQKEVGVTAVTREYDGTRAATVMVNQADILEADRSEMTVTVSGALYDNKNAGTGKVVSYTAVVEGDGLTPSNYKVGSTTEGAITAKQLTLSAVADSKTYDGTAASGQSVGVAGLVQGDSVSGLTQAFSSKNAGNRTLAVNGGYTVADGNGGNNYVVAKVGANGTILQKEVGVTAVTKEYDGTRAAMVVVNQADIIAADRSDVAVSVSGALYDNKNAGTGKVVSYTAVVEGDGLAPSNYKVGSTTEGTITAKQLTLSAVADSKTYDGTAASGQSVGVAGLVQGDSVSGLTQAFSSKNAGNRTLAVNGGYTVADGNGGNNYVVAKVGANGTILQKEVGVTAVTKEYDGTRAAMVVVNQADILEADRSEMTVTVSGALYDNKNAGTGKVVSYTAVVEGDGLAPSNYKVGSTTEGAITAKQLTLTAVADSKTYDGTNLSNQAVLVNGIVQGDTVSSLTQSFDSRNAGGRTLSVNGGYTVADGNGGNNYTVNTTSAQGSISKAQLTLAAVADSKVYNGSTASSGVVGVNGLVQGDTLTGATQAFDSRHAGNRTLTVNGGYTVADGNGGNNYTVSTTSAQGSIAQAQLSLQAVADVKVFDGSAASSRLPVLAGTLFGSDSAMGQGTQTFDSAAVGAQKLITPNVGTLVINDGNQGANYSITLQTALGSITPAIVPPVVVTPEPPRVDVNPQPTPIDLTGLGDLLSQLPPTAAGEEEEDEKIKARRRSDRSPVRVMDGGIKLPPAPR